MAIIGILFVRIHLIAPMEIYGPILYVIFKTKVYLTGSCRIHMKERKQWHVVLQKYFLLEALLIEKNTVPYGRTWNMYCSEIQAQNASKNNFISLNLCQTKEEALQLRLSPHYRRVSDPDTN